jgi:hypothetical protein
VGEKEIQFLFEHSDDVSGYKSQFSEFNVSLNFNPMNWALDTKQLRSLSTVTTHSSICLRNPYDMLYSWYNFVGTRPKNYVDRYIELNFVDYTDTLRRLRNHFDPLVLLFDDLNYDPQKFLDSVTNHLGLTNIPYYSSIEIANKKKTNDHLEYSDKQVETINICIDEFSEYMGRDLSHWKRP